LVVGIIAVALTNSIIRSITIPTHHQHKQCTSKIQATLNHIDCKGKSTLTQSSEARRKPANLASKAPRLSDAIGQAQFHESNTQPLSDFDVFIGCHVVPSQLPSSKAVS